LADSSTIAVLRRELRWIRVREPGDDEPPIAQPERIDPALRASMIALCKKMEAEGRTGFGR